MLICCHVLSPNKLGLELRLLILFSHDNANPDRVQQCVCLACVCMRSPSGVIARLPTDCTSSWRSRLQWSEVDKCRPQIQTAYWWSWAVKSRQEPLLCLCSPSSVFYFTLKKKLLCQSCDMTQRQKKILTLIASWQSNWSHSLMQAVKILQLCNFSFFPHPLPQFCH